MHKTTASEMLFLLPEPLCKSCGAHIPPEFNDCPKCGKRFKWSLREKIARVLIMSYVTKEFAKEEAARALTDFKAKRWCKRHGFQRTLTLPKDGKEIVCCIKCLAIAMAKPIRCGGKDYPMKDEGE
jgi:ribosomal protein L40E